MENMHNNEVKETSENMLYATSEQSGIQSQNEENFKEKKKHKHIDATRRKQSIGSIVYIICMFVFLYLPILVTMIFSFNSSRSLIKMEGFSLKWYERLLTDRDIIAAVWVSVSVAVIATVISTILGTITAIGLSKCRKVLRDTILNINNIPIMNPDIVTAIGLMILFSSIAVMQKGYMTMLLAHVMFCTPYVITSVYPKVRSMDVNLANAAMDLGATPFQALTKVILPVIKPGVYAGVLLSFTMSFDDFVVSYFVTGNGVSNISIVVYNMTKRANPTINALSTIVIAVIMVSVLFVNLVPMLTKKENENKLHRHQKMKKAFSLALAGLLVVVLVLGAVAGFGRSNSSSKQTLKVFNAGEYIDKSLIKKFEEEYNCDVVYETFDSNESMYTKIVAGNEYDILVPSDYMIERLIKEDYLQEIDWSLIPNKDKLLPELLNRDFDPESRYGVPYFWGSVGILYDTTKIAEEDIEQGWELLRNEKYKGDIYMYDSERDSMMIALKALGYSMNTQKKSELDEAYEWLREQRDIMEPVYVGDDVIDNMISGNKALAVVYSGDGALIMSENENLDFFEPQQGTNLWYDCMVMTKTCKNTELAHAFMNFMIEEENAYINDVEVGYSSSVASVFEKMKNEDYEGLEAYVPRTGFELDEVFGYQDPEIKRYSADLWTKVKAQ